MIDKLARNVSQAVFKHYNAALSKAINIFAEADPLKPKEKTHIEMRVNGPDTCEDTTGEYYVEFEVSLLITVVQPNNIYAVEDLIDLVRKHVRSIPMQNGICAELMQDRTRGNLLEVNKFGQIDTALDLHQASVNGTYNFTLKE